MMSRFVLAFLLVIPAACTAVPQVGRPPLPCDYSDFEVSPYDHLLESMPEILSVSAFTGRLRTRPEDIVGGVWPPGLDPRIELHGPGGLTEFVTVSEDGAFSREGLRPGEYCFKISANGFRSILGTITVDRKRGDDVPIEIQLMLAE